MFGNKRGVAMVLVLLLALIVACASPTPEVIEKEVIVEKPVVETVVVEKEKVVEKLVIQTVVVEKEKVVTVIVEPTKVIPKWSDRTFVKAYNRAPENIDPHGSGYDNTHEPVLRSLYEPLLDYNPETQELEGILATEWEVGPDGKAFTFKLRQGVKFHDGSDLTAEAVKLSLERIVDQGFARAGFLRDLDKVEVVDDLTVRIHLQDTNAVFLSKVSDFLIASAEALKAHFSDDWFLTNEAGSYAYKLEYFKPGTDVVKVEPFPDYWRGWEPLAEGTHLGRIETRIVPETPTQRMLLESGEAHFMQRFPISFVFETEDHPVARPISMRTYRVSFLPLNVAHGPLQDIRLRKMLLYAFPYEALVEDYYQGMAPPAAGPLHPKFVDDPTLEPMEQDLDKAKEFLEEAGYKPGELTLTYLYPTGGEEQKQPGILLQDALRQIGVELQVDTIPWANIVERVASGPENAPDIMTLINSPKSAEAGPGLLEQFWHSANAGRPYNWGYYINPEIDELLAEAERTVDDEERLEIYRQLQRMGLEDVAGIFICYPDRWVLVSRDLGGYWFDPIGMEWQPWYDMYWKK